MTKPRISQRLGDSSLWQTGLGSRWGLRTISCGSTRVFLLLVPKDPVSEVDILLTSYLAFIESQSSPHVPRHYQLVQTIPCSLE